MLITSKVLGNIDLKGAKDRYNKDFLSMIQTISRSSKYYHQANVDEIIQHYPTYSKLQKLNSAMKKKDLSKEEKDSLKSEKKEFSVSKEYLSYSSFSKKHQFNIMRPYGPHQVARIHTEHKSLYKSIEVRLTNTDHFSVVVTVEKSFDFLCNVVRRYGTLQSPAKTTLWNIVNSKSHYGLTEKSIGLFISAIEHFIAVANAAEDEEGLSSANVSVNSLTGIALDNEEGLSETNFSDEDIEIAKKDLSQGSNPDLTVRVRLKSVSKGPSSNLKPDSGDVSIVSVPQPNELPDSTAEVGLARKSSTEINSKPVLTGIE